MGKVLVIRSKNRQIPLPHDHAIRSRLLNSLGIYKASPVRSPEHRRKHGIKSGMPTSHQRSLHVVPFRRPLNDSAVVVEDYSFTIRGGGTGSENPPLAFSPPTCGTPRSVGSSINNNNSSSSSCCCPTNDRSIQFQDEVLVVPIPSRHEYSDRIKRVLWSGGDELSELVERNRAEFASEGWDVNFVIEEDDMYVDAGSGELVHPIWFQEEEEEENGDPMAMDENTSNEGFPKLTRSTSFSTNLHRLSH